MNLVKKTLHFSFQHSYPAVLILFAFFLFLFSQPKVSAESSVGTLANSKNTNPNEALVILKSEKSIQALVEKESLMAVPLTLPNEKKDIVLVKSLEQKPTSKIIHDLKKNPAVEFVQPNFRYQPLARVANDKYFPRQWWLFDLGASLGSVGAASAWDMESKKQPDVAIAVIDSGANYKHKDLKKNLTRGSAKGRNFENPKRKPTDSDGHGSFLAGIIGAQSQNKKGIAGASFFNNLKIMPLRFDFTTSQAIEALNYAKTKNVPVVNASWGNYGDEEMDLALKDAIASYGGVFVAASGNNAFNHDGGNSKEKMYPCDFDLPNIICVGASDKNGNLADYSDYGAVSIDVVAPGGTEDNPLIGLSSSKSRYTQAIGSSLAAAFVSAEAGLIISKYPNLSATQVIEIIKKSVDTSPNLAGKVLSGGKVNFQKALQNAASY